MKKSRNLITRTQNYRDNKKKINKNSKIKHRINRNHSQIINVAHHKLKKHLNLNSKMINKRGPRLKYLDLMKHILWNYKINLLTL